MSRASEKERGKEPEEEKNDCELLSKDSGKVSHRYSRESRHWVEKGSLCHRVITSEEALERSESHPIWSE